METKKELSLYYSNCVKDFTTHMSNKDIIEVYNSVERNYRTICEDGSTLLPNPEISENKVLRVEIEALNKFEFLKLAFEYRHGYNNIKVIQQEYDSLKIFFDKVDLYSINEALNPNILNESALVEYIRLNDRHYYKRNDIDYTSESLSVYVLAIYIHFYQWLQEQIINAAKGIINGYKTAFSTPQLSNLYKLLSSPENGFISSETNENDFLTVFNPKLQIKNPIIWVMETSRVKGQTAKKALLDLLELLGVSFSEIRDKKRLEKCFSDKNHKALKYFGENYREAAKSKSEYHDQLTEIINSVK